MARIRTIKPEFPDDETLGSVSRDARLLYILLWTRCDDYGRCRAATPYLRGQLFPYDEDVTSGLLEGWLAELSDAGRVTVYEVEGQRYLEVSHWARHQRIDNAGKALCPPPLGGSPRDSAGLGGSPLDPDPDPDLDPDDDLAADHGGKLSTTPAFWEDVWTEYAAKVTRNSTPKNPEAYKRRVRRTAPAEQKARAEDLLAKFELSAVSLGRVLAGEESILRTAPRRVRTA